MMGHAQMIPNKLMMRQDEDTDNEPPGTDGDDSARAYHQSKTPTVPHRGDKLAQRSNQAQLHPKELLTEGDCDMNEEGDNSENVTNEASDQMNGSNRVNEHPTDGTKKPKHNRSGNNQNQ